VDRTNNTLFAQIGEDFIKSIGRSVSRVDEQSGRLVEEVKDLMILIDCGLNGKINYRRKD
jgi:hypothetical protein